MYQVDSNNLHALAGTHLCEVEEVVSSWPANLQKTAVLVVSSQEDTKTLVSVKS